MAGDCGGGCWACAPGQAAREDAGRYGEDNTGRKFHDDLLLRVRFDERRCYASRRPRHARGGRSQGSAGFKPALFTSAMSMQGGFQTAIYAARRMTASGTAKS
jgi:hypothetical protein